MNKLSEQDLNKELNEIDQKFILTDQDLGCAKFADQIILGHKEKMKQHLYTIVLSTDGASQLCHHLCHELEVAPTALHKDLPEIKTYDLRERIILTAENVFFKKLTTDVSLIGLKNVSLKKIHNLIVTDTGSKMVISLLFSHPVVRSQYLKQLN